MQTINLGLGSLPVFITCVEDGRVAFNKIPGFSSVIDNDQGQAVVGAFYGDHFTLTAAGVLEDYSYGQLYGLKYNDTIVSYLKQQTFVNPFGEVVYAPDPQPDAGWQPREPEVPSEPAPDNAWKPHPVEVPEPEAPVEAPAEPVAASEPEAAPEVAPEAVEEPVVSQRKRKFAANEDVS